MKTTSTLGILIASAIFCFSQPVAAKTAMGSAWDAYDRGDYDQAIFFAMQQENYAVSADAEYLMGLMLLHGQGTGVNYSAAAYRFGQAAQKGHAEAQCMFGAQLLRGQGVGKTLSWRGSGLKLRPNRIMAAGKACWAGCISTAKASPPTIVKQCAC
jgi:TPR repeat protein